jgi:hypothetical protein
MYDPDLGVALLQCRNSAPTRLWLAREPEGGLSLLFHKLWRELYNLSPRSTLG